MPYSSICSLDMTGSHAQQVTDPLFALARFASRRGMALIKLRKANETGEDEGIVFVNTDQIVSVGTGQTVTEIRLVDGRIQWIKESPEEVVALAKSTG
jgi:hypothetical protein